MSGLAFGSTRPTMDPFPIGRLERSENRQRQEASGALRMLFLCALRAAEPAAYGAGHSSGWIMQGVLVTGGAKRIGSEICRHMAARGWHVLVHYFSSGDAAAAPSL